MLQTYHQTALSSTLQSRPAEDHSSLVTHPFLDTSCANVAYVRWSLSSSLIQFNTHIKDAINLVGRI
jgi:hypothetical protein